MFSNEEEHLFAPSSAFRWKERGMTTEISWQSLLKWLASYSSRGYVLFLMRVHSFSHRRTQKNRTHKGSQRHQVNRYHRTLQLILVERPLWILYAGGLLWVRNVGGKVLLNLWVLWEKNSPASFANVLFLTEKHRRTEHTKVHRDIKSTDFTEPYTHL